MGDEDMDSELVIVSNENDLGIKGLLVPCETNEFAEFLSGLLKTPKIVRYRSTEPFVLRHRDIEDFFRILNQRISEQLKNSVISFDISIFYDNGISHQFSTMSEFSEHRDLSNSVCLKLIATVTYLVELPESDVPKKQEIQLAFDVSQFSKPTFVEEGHVIAHYSTTPCSIKLEIRHTHVTLGNDLCNLMKLRINQLSRKSEVSRFLSNAWMKAIWIGSFGLLGLGLASYTTTFVAGYLFGDITELKDVFQSGALTTSLVISSFLTFFFAIASLIFGTITIDNLAKKPASMIITSSEHEAALKASDVLYGRRWIIVGLSLVGTIGIGVFTSLVATGLWTQLFG
jgi:hypothetical protein